MNEGLLSIIYNSSVNFISTQKNKTKYVHPAAGRQWRNRKLKKIIIMSKRSKKIITKKKLNTL